MSEPEMAPRRDVMIICGLGRMGQACARVLKDFGVTVHGVESVRAHRDETAETHIHFDKVVTGDCRVASVLERAGIADGRAILFVTGDERANIAAAFAARSLNPHVRILVRSAQHNLNDLLAETLGNFAAFEPTRLSTTAFALAGLGGETVGLVKVDGRMLPVLRRIITARHSWCGTRRLADLNGRSRRLLAHVPAAGPARLGFHQWDPTARLEEGDVVTWMELGGTAGLDGAERGAPLAGESEENAAERPHGDFGWGRLKAAVARLWAEANQAKRAVMLSGGVVLGLYLCGVGFYMASYPEISLHDALNVATVLVLGGYDNLFGQLTLPFPITPWLHLFSVLLTVASTIFIGVVYASLTERVLSAHFTFRQRRPSPPEDNHVVLVGLGKAGRQVAELLLELKQPVVGVQEGEIKGELPARLPVITGPLSQSLRKVNLARARSVMAMTDDEVANLEIVLTARAANPDCRLVVRTDDPALSRNLSALVPGANAFGTYALAADAFAGAAFGENILGMFHLGRATVLVTEYRVEEGDTLVGLLMSDIAYGYGVVPILHEDPVTGALALPPGDDGRLRAGERLIVLATIDGLKNVERGRLAPGEHRIRVERAINEQAAFTGAMTIARVTGCEPGAARQFMGRLPEVLEMGLYEHQAHRLVNELNRGGIRAEIVGEGGEEEITEGLRPPEPTHQGPSALETR